MVTLRSEMSIVTRTTPRLGSNSKEFTERSSSPLPALCASTRVAVAAIVIADIDTDTDSNSKPNHLSTRRTLSVSPFDVSDARQPASFEVVETGVDPVTPRFSGVCSAN